MREGKLSLPRVTTRQAETPLYEALACRANRLSGILIFAYLAFHLIGQAVLYVPQLGGRLPQLLFLSEFQYLPWVRAILFASIMFHCFYGLNLMALDLGVRLKSRIPILTISVMAILSAIWELFRYGHN
jgi:succinate dehydrogenase/fumarate reductase cytochrome b subunit